MLHKQIKKKKRQNDIKQSEVKRYVLLGMILKRDTKRWIKPVLNKKSQYKKTRDFKIDAKSRNCNKIKEKSDVMNKVITLFKGRELFYNDFESRIFLLLNRSIALTKPEKSNLSEHPISPQNLSS